MGKVNFTASRIKDFACPPGKGQDFLWDAEVKGLGLRVTANGSKAYVFRYKRDGQSPRVKIGSPDAWTIPQAREEARRMQREVDQGKDPANLKAIEIANSTKEAARKSAMAEAALVAWDDYLEVRRVKWSERNYQDHVFAAQRGGQAAKIGKKLTKPQPLASLLILPLSEITATKVKDWLSTESKQRPTATENAYRKLRTFVSWCAGHQKYSSIVCLDCCTHPTVKECVPRSKARPDDCLQREELADWFRAVRGISNIVISAYLQTVLLTGARRGEMLKLRWDNVCLHPASCTIGDKVEGERVIPLTPYLVNLLQQLPRRNEWVFFSDNSASGHIIEPTKAHRTALKNIGLDHVSIHGLRRSFSTMSEWVDVPIGVTAQIMGHKPSALREKHYTRRPLDMLRMHHVKIENWILEQAGIANEAMASGITS